MSVPLKVRVFFDEQGRPKHILFGGVRPGEAVVSACGRVAPAFLQTARPRMVNAEGLKLHCRKCAAQLNDLIRVHNLEWEEFDRGTEE